MDVLAYIKNSITLLDGGMGTLLQAAGLQPGEMPERWNLTRPDEIVRVHRAYFDAGSNIVNTNTFGANCLKFSEEELDETVKAAVKNARAAADESVGTQPKYVALDIGPTGRMLEPIGPLPFEEAVEIFAKTVRLGVKYGVDLIMIETFTDLYETKAAVLAAKENSDLPVFVSNAYSDNGRLLTGAPPLAVIATLEGLGADAIGVNCSYGPAALLPVIETYLEKVRRSGADTVILGCTHYDLIYDLVQEKMPDVRIVSSSRTLVQELKEILTGSHRLSRRKGKDIYLSSSCSERLDQIAAKIIPDIRLQKK